MNSFKECREKAGLTQKEVAYALKMSVQAVSYWETGERMPSYHRLFELADLYHVSTDELLGRKPIELKKPAERASELDEELIDLLTNLPEGDAQRVQDFVEGLKASRIKRDALPR